MALPSRSLQRLHSTVCIAEDTLPSSLGTLQMGSLLLQRVHVCMCIVQEALHHRHAASLLRSVSCQLLRSSLAYLSILFHFLSHLRSSTEEMVRRRVGKSSSPTDRPTAALHSFSCSPFPCTPIAVLLRRSPSVLLYLLLHPATISAN